MKAMVKATGEIVDLNLTLIDDYDFVDSKGVYYTIEQLELIRETIKPIKNTSDPDYWTRLEHQYAGMAMQGMLAGQWTEMIFKCTNSDGQHFDVLAHKAKEAAHALVEKMKEERK